MELETLDHIGLAVSDVERSVDWYREVLGLNRAFEDAWDGYPAVMVAGGSGVALFPARGAPIPATGSYDDLVHIGFRTSRAGFEAARQELVDSNTPFREADHGVAWSLYVLDPDGYLVEIATYVAG
jgi:catechol 2,3-dioxygenase-like lactoylglutathione lyase family enzyme